MLSSKRLAISALLGCAAVTDLVAQCPDGSPPPCDTRKPAALTVLKSPPPVPPAADRGRRFLILPFRNVTRQADQDWLVEGSTALLVEDLNRWQGITVVPDEKLYPALKRAGITPGQIADESKVRRVAEETGGWTAVTGDVLATGGRVRITARAWDVPTNKELVRASTEIAATGDVRAAFDTLSRKLLQTTGVDASSADFASTSTRNLEAYKSYVSGNAHMRRAEIKPAIDELQKAVRLDSNFAMAWARLSELAASAEPGSIMNPQSNVARYSARAVSLASNLPAHDRDLVLANAALFGAQFTTARHLLEGLIAKDSNDVEAMTQLVGVEQSDFVLTGPPGAQRPRGSKNNMARLAKRVLELDPSRQTMYAVLANIYASAGVPGSQPEIGIDQEPASFPDLMRLAQQRQHLRIYNLILRDTLVRVPVESLSFIPRDTLDALRKNARAAVRGWIDRWVAAAPNEAAAWASLAQVNTLDRDFPGALKALNRADSIGVQIPTFSVPVRRMTLLGRSGDLRGATRLADSIAATPFFAAPSSVLVNGDGAAWAFALETGASRYARAGTLFDQVVADWRAVGGGTGQPEMTAFLMIMGNDNPNDEPGIPRAVRGMQLDSMVAHVNDAAATSLAPFLPLMLQEIAEDADTTHRRVREMLKAAEMLAASGHTQLAFEVANTAVSSDSTLEAEAAKAAWYRTAAEAYNAVKTATAARFHPASATIAADRAVFEWKVDDSLPFVRNRPETPPSRVEYRWSAMINSGDRAFRIAAGAIGRDPGAPARSGTLADLLPPTARRVFSVGKALPNGEQTELNVQQNIGVRTEVAPGVLRLIVTDKTVLDDLRRTKPTEATFRFEPCVRPVGSTAKLQCPDVKVPIVYP